MCRGHSSDNVFEKMPQRGHEGACIATYHVAAGRAYGFKSFDKCVDVCVIRQATNWDPSISVAKAVEEEGPHV